ncbi:MAG: ESX secretion-associated protein EspG [Acidimicrobiia bacterium]|nr:ESX secretion-associated protein EspG [Acidimicrobiia bacterium]
MQAVLDAGRGTLTLPRRLVPSVMLLGTHGSDGAARVRLRDLVELERAGITTDRQLHPQAADMLEVVIAPTRVVTIEVTTDEGTAISTIWIRRTSAVLGRPAGPDLFRLGPIEVGLLTFHLAQLVTLGPRPDAPISGSVTVPADLLDELEMAWSANPADAASRLIADGIDPGWAERLTVIHCQRRSRWRISSLWIGDDGTAGDTEVIVLDAGPAGYWQILPDGDDVGQITFATRRFVDLLEMLQGI